MLDPRAKALRQVVEAVREALVETGWEIAFSPNEDGTLDMMGIDGPENPPSLGVGPCYDGVYVLMELPPGEDTRLCIAGFLPTPRRAGELLAEYGITCRKLRRVGGLPPMVPEDA